MAEQSADRRRPVWLAIGERTFGVKLERRSSVVQAEEAHEKNWNGCGVSS
jgi:hypothetical protein